MWTHSATTKAFETREQAEADAGLFADVWELPEAPAVPSVSSSIRTVTDPEVRARVVVSQEMYLHSDEPVVTEVERRLKEGLRDRGATPEQISMAELRSERDEARGQVVFTATAPRMERYVSEWEPGPGPHVRAGWPVVLP